MQLDRMNEEKERLSELHFHLSNADRRRIIEELQMQPLKLTEVAKKLDITATEASRQLQRLTDAGFLEKTNDGRYRATTYSSLILESSAAMDFLCRHREYFLEHDTSLIPPHLRARFGELSKTVLQREAVPNINAANDVLKNAEKRIEVIADYALAEHTKILKQRSLEGVRIRYVSQESVIEIVKEDLASDHPSGERRFVPRVCGVMILTDKVMGISLPKLDGKMDYQVFTGNDPASMRWAGDLFEDQWNRGRSWHA